jgi:hypothetical protein
MELGFYFLFLQEQIKDIIIERARSLSLSLSLSVCLSVSLSLTVTPLFLASNIIGHDHGTECLQENVFEIWSIRRRFSPKKIQSVLLGRRRAPKMLAQQCIQVSDFCENGGGWR